MSRASCRGRSTIVAVAVVASILSGEPGAMGADKLWADPDGGSFDDPSDWSPLGPPGADDTPVFDLDRDGYVVTFNSDVQTLPFRIRRDAVTFDLGGHAYVVPLTAGSSALIGAATPSGDAGLGRLTIVNGRMNLSGGTMSISPDRDSIGFLNVSRNATLDGNPNVGNGGAGQLLIDQGGTVNSSRGRIGWAPLGAPGHGEAIVKGAGSSWNHAGTLPVASTGYGSLSVFDGGRVTTASLMMADQPATRSDVVVDGGNSLLEAIGTVGVGWNGTASLTVRNGGRVTSDALTFAAGPSASGTVSVDGPGSTIALNTYLEFRGLGTASLTLSNGGTLKSIGGLFYSEVLSATPPVGGTVLITGPGSSWEASDSLAFAPTRRYSITVADGGNLTARSLRFESGGPHVPEVTIEGPGSTASFDVASHSTVLLNVRDGSNLVSRNAFLNSNVSSPTAKAHVTGPGSNWTVTTQGLNVGTSGNGELHVDAGAVVEVRSRLAIGGYWTTSALVRVTGNGSRLLVDSDIPVEIGDEVRPSGRAELQVLDRGHFAAPAVRIHPYGRVTVDGGATIDVGSMENTGIVLIRGGTATLRGPVSNTGTFDVAEGAEVRFLASVTGGSFTGFGMKRFEAGQSHVASMTSVGGTLVQAPAVLKVARLNEDHVIVRGRLEMLRPGSPVTNVIRTLDIEDQGVVDLANTALVLITEAETQAAVLARIERYIASARNAAAGRWNGPGLTSSTAAGAPLTTLGIGTTAGNVIVLHTYNGDANLDGRVNADDYFRIDQGFLAQPTTPTYREGDFNYDAHVNADDYFLIDQAFLGQGAVMSDSNASSSLMSAAVPEPATALTLAILTTASLTRRRRRTQPEP